MENISKNNSLESAKNRLDISGLTYLGNTKYVNDRLVSENIDEVFKKYLPIVKNVDGDDVLRYKNLMNQYYWLINKFIPTCSYEQLCIRGGEKKWVEFTDICELRGEVLFRYLDFNYKVLNVITLLKGNTVDNNTSASLPGYAFLGWFTEREGGELFDFNTPITEDTDVFAQYEINTYQITFVYDDGDTDTITVNYNELPHPSHVPSKNGYTFTGWDKTIVPATSDATYTAKYKINKYTVEFYDITNPDISLDEYFLIYTEEVKYEQGVVNIPANPTYPHYNFIRWSDGVDTGHSIDLTCITANTMAYAEVEPKTYTVIFYDWDNTVLDEQEVVYGNSAVAPDDPTGRTDYIFVGWDKDFSNIKSNTYIHALYEGEPLKVEFLLPYDDESDILYYSAYTAYNTTISEPAKPSMEEYSPYEYGLFDGWYIDSAYTAQYDFSNLITNDTVIYGKWKEWFEVSFYNWDNTLITGNTAYFVNPVYVNYGGNVPSAVTEAIEECVLPKEGYDFLGWNKSTTGITHDTKITALFSDVQMCTVRFINSVDRSVISTMRVELGSAILSSDYPEVPEIQKYYFSYWDGNTTEVISDMDVVAVYEPALMNVHYVNIIGEPILDTTARYLSTGETPVVELETLTVQGMEPDKPYVYYMMKPTGEFCLVTDEEDLYVEPDEDCINPESMVITEYDTTFVAKYDVIETGITSYNVKFFSQDRVYFFEKRELYGTVIDSNYTNDILQIFDENGHGVTGNTQIFECWVDQDGNEYRNGINDYVVTSNISLTARYEFKKSPVKFYNASDNTEVTELAMMAIVNNPIARPNYLLIPEKPFYNRLINSDANNIWYKDIACTQEWEFKPSTVDKIQPDTEYSLYANVYEGVSYNLIFATNGGSDIPPEVVQYPNVTVRPVDPTKQGYNFAGWYTNNTYQEEFVFGEQLFQNTVIYAKWEESPVVFRIIYNATSDLRHVPALETMGDGVNIIREQCTYDSETGSGSLAYDNEITEIPNRTFENIEALKSINIPNSVTNIGEYAFFGCASLTSIVIPNNITIIRDGVFCGCLGLTSFIIPENITNLGGYAFSGCRNLISVVIPENVTDIGAFAFGTCDNLGEITCNAINPPLLGSNVFAEVPTTCKLYVPCESVSLYEAAAQWQDLDIQRCEGTILYLSDSSTVIIPDNVLTQELISDVYENALVACEIGDNVTEIGNGTFYGCDCLTSLTIPDSVTSIGESALFDCSSLASVTIPNSVTSIGNRAFYSCTGLTSITIPNSITRIGNGTFYGCRSLISVTIPNSVTNIGEYAFMDCYSLTSLTIPNSVTSIGNAAFRSCSSLVSITIPNSVTSIGDYAFHNCSSLEEIVCESITPPTISAGVFANTNDCPIYVPCEAVEDYKASWNAYEDRIQCHQQGTILYLSDSSTVVIPDNVLTEALISNVYSGTVVACEVGDNVTEIGDYAFCDCSGLTSVTIPNSVTSIGDNAFENDSSLTSATIPNSVINIGDSAFNGCSSLTSVTIPNSVTSIGVQTFYNCSSLTSVTIPNSVTSIGYQAFSRCTSLTSVTIPNSVTSIGDMAFYFCSGLASIEIPNSVTSIENAAFRSCASLEEIVCESTIPPAIGQNVFYNTNNCPIYVPCEAVNDYKAATNWSTYESRIKCRQQGTILHLSDSSTVVIPDNVLTRELISEAYSGTVVACEVGDNVTEIGDYTFRDCNSLTSVTISDSVTTIGVYIFYGCENIYELIIGDGLTGSFSTSDLTSANPMPGIRHIKIGNGYTSIANRALYYNTNIQCFDFGNNIVTIGDEAFRSCSNLSSITIPDTVTTFGQNCFLSSKVPSSLTITSAVTSIGEGAFSSNSGLRNVKFNENTIMPSKNMCYNCANLETIDLPSTISSMRGDSFSYCSNLISVTIRAVTPPSIVDGRTPFYGSNCTIYVPAESVEAYKTAPIWQYIEATRFQPIP